MSVDSVIRVERRKKLGWLERLYGPAAVRSLFVSARHFFRGWRGGVEGRFSVPVPSGEPRLGAPSAFRGMPVLVSRSDGRARCVACGLCARVCPAACISIAPDPDAGEGLDGRPLAFELDMARCTYCGLCEEVCPVEAIVMSPHVENAAFDRASLVFDLERLLVPSELLEPRLRFLRDRREATGEATVPLLRLAPMPGDTARPDAS